MDYVAKWYMPSKIKICLCSGKSNEFKADLPWCAVVRVIEQCCFNSTPDPFNGQTANFILKPPKVIEPRTYVKKANLECYWNNTVLLLWQQHNKASLVARKCNKNNLKFTTLSEWPTNLSVERRTSPPPLASQLLCLSLNAASLFFCRIWRTVEWVFTGPRNCC